MKRLISLFILTISSMSLLAGCKSKQIQDVDIPNTESSSSELPDNSEEISSESISSELPDDSTSASGQSGNNTDPTQSQGTSGNGGGSPDPGPTPGGNNSQTPGTSAPPPVTATSVTLNKTGVSLEVGGTVQLSATVKPDNTANKAVSWKSGNTNVVTVSGGLVKAVGNGSTTITVTTSNGHTATCSVTVTKASLSSSEFNTIVNAVKSHAAKKSRVTFNWTPSLASRVVFNADGSPSMNDSDVGWSDTPNFQQRGQAKIIDTLKYNVDELETMMVNQSNTIADYYIITFKYQGDDYLMLIYG